MKSRKYPLSMFITGVVLELIKMWYFLVLTILIFLVRLFISGISIVIPFVALTAWVVMAIIRQFKNKRTILNMNGDEDTNNLLDKMFTDNYRGYKNIIDSVNEIIEKSENQSDS